VINAERSAFSDIADQGVHPESIEELRAMTRIYLKTAEGALIGVIGRQALPSPNKKDFMASSFTRNPAVRRGAGVLSLLGDALGTVADRRRRLAWIGPPRL
jgi:hypothetical protein